VPFGLRSLDVEPDAVVAQDEFDLVTVLLDGEPHVRRLRVLQSVHHSLSSDVVQE
jgi:hypothetical protein